MTLLIIADDLSGAADCAIAFAGAGQSTVVALDPSHDTGGGEGGGYRYRHSSALASTGR